MKLYIKAAISLLYFNLILYLCICIKYKACFTETGSGITLREGVLVITTVSMVTEANATHCRIG